VVQNGVCPFAVLPGVLEEMAKLVESLIEKTNYHRQKHAKKFGREVAKLGKGEFRLNVLDPTAPLFTKLTESEVQIRREKKKLLDPNSDL
jgi:hypothetical protein